jgi:hypothetical protein|tara:strand:+ start:649 stop:1035 length:387 start_codon:yes stop_codon:yes gene_type:complete
MEDIDKYLYELSLKDSVNNYIHNGIKPQYKKIKIKEYPKLDECKYLIDITNHEKIDITGLLNKCNLLTEKINDFYNFDEECPICFKNINSSTYITPLCGHKICSECYICCLEKKTTYSNKCSICRSPI